MEKGIFKAVSETTSECVIGNLIQDVDEDGEVLTTRIRDRETGVKTDVYDETVCSELEIKDHMGNHIFEYDEVEVKIRAILGWRNEYRFAEETNLDGSGYLTQVELKSPIYGDRLLKGIITKSFYGVYYVNGMQIDPVEVNRNCLVTGNKFSRK